MRKSLRTFATLTAAALVAVLGTTAAAGAGTGHAPGSLHDGYGSTPGSHHDIYGHTKIRGGIPVTAARFGLSSPDVRNGGRIPDVSWGNGFGCTGGNQPIRLRWKGAPKTARSFAVSMQDLDATTGSGFWHWMAWDIPANTTTLDRTLPAGATSGTNDGGRAGYAGPCPPAGDIAHRYRITVYALDTPSLGLPAAGTPAVAAFTLSSHTIGYGRITATARR
ncbi:Raf kinase inhibitor-like YbhB/YbcL family protein [Streptomyces sp. B4I13]|uniref:YbhB/YbcL family Raf kinase inhibitor-like protein n=1 Tax=Streptomyces sp. B4I13 TaxID=3042271 RepID=UPI00278A67F7|nr:YbhB/YbcL family Raf kinase inhibitor-like protein [Streptomyces sp. B4I13]MDQ0960702.1 Raf kinase inhibitor-like YbhB/YbcL family protein [Streptomyces sp. B4I13]